MILGTLSGLVAILLFSVSALMMAYIGDLPPLQTVFVNQFGGALLFMAVYKLRGLPIAPMFAQSLKAYLVYIGGITGFTILYFISLTKLPPYLVTIIVSFWPINLVLLSAIIGHKKIGPLLVFGGCIAFIGPVLVLAQTATGSAALETGAAWYVWVLPLLCSLIWPAYSVLSTRMQLPNGFMIPVLLVSSLFVLPAHFVFEQTILPHNALQWTMYALWVLHCSALLFWETGMKKGDAHLVATLSHLSPLLSFVWLIAAGFKPASPVLVYAGFAVAAGVLIAHGRDFYDLWMERRRPCSAGN